MARTSLYAAGLGLALALASGCDRAAEPLLCGDLAAGDLVISEVRGGSQVFDADGQWLELYNASGAAIDVHGLALTITNISGSVDARLLLRRAYSVAPGAYAVLGRFDDPAVVPGAAALPAHVDVGWGKKPDIQVSGTIAIACGGELDKIVYGRDGDPPLPDPSEHPDTQPPSLPPPAGKGTYALGLTPPDATGNDDIGNWCADSTETLGPCSNGTCLEYYKGSPGEPNPACPP